MSVSSPMSGSEFATPPFSDIEQIRRLGNVENLVTETGQNHEVCAPGGKLAVTTYGSPEGRPVFLLHGSPGSRLGPVPRFTTLYRQNIRLVTYDRPGYGESEARPLPIGEYPRIADTAVDLLSIADHLAIDRFSVVGRSGGGPHALAAMLLPPHRLKRIAVMVGLEPPEQEIHSILQSVWHEGMASSNVKIHKDTMEGRRATIKRIVAGMAINAANLCNEWWDEIGPEDKRVVANIGFARQLVASYREAVRPGPEGWLRDLEALHNPDGWGIDLESNFSAKEIVFWHGMKDRLSPPQHSRNLASIVPWSQLVQVPYVGHFAAFEAFPRVAAWAARDGEEVPLTTPSLPPALL